MLLLGMRRTILIHSLLWLLYYVYFIYYNHLLLLEESDVPLRLADRVLYLFSLTGVFYGTSLYLLPRFFRKKKYLPFLMGSVVLFGLYCVYQYILDWIIYPWLYTGAEEIAFKPVHFLIANGYHFLPFYVYGLGYWLARHALQREQEKRQLLERHQKMEMAKRQLEEEALRTELSFLRSQINPHFLYNTLSYLYTKAYPVSEELAEGIAKLSDIMRYALKEGVEQEVPLPEEIEHLHNFIALQQARFSNRLQVQFKVEGPLEEKKILPMVLISFVENAFKHGDLRQEADPLRICIAAREQQLAFVVKNRKSNGSAIPSTHIGNQNIQKRLALAYGERHQLSIWEDEQHYRCELIIHA